MVLECTVMYCSVLFWSWNGPGMVLEWSWKANCLCNFRKKLHEDKVAYVVYVFRIGKGQQGFMWRKR